jgi:hypothetical protein
MRRKSLLSVIAGLAMVLCIGAGLTAGAEYPTKEITYIIAFNPGGESDIEFRLMQPFSLRQGAPLHGISPPLRRLTAIRLPVLMRRTLSRSP